MKIALLQRILKMQVPDRLLKDPFIEPYIIERLGLEETLKLIQFHPPAMGTDPFHQPRLLKAPSNLALNPARAATASLSNLCQGLTTVTLS